MRIKPSKKTMFAMAAIAFILFGICGYTYYNRASKLSVLQASIDKKESQLANSEKIARQLTEVESKYQQAQFDLGTLEKGVSTRAYVPTLLRQIEDLGKKTNLRVVGVKPQPVIATPAPVTPPSGEGGDADKSKPAPVAKKPDPYEKLTIDLTVTGKYWDVVKFVQEITDFPKIVAVNSVQIMPIKASDGVGSPDLSVKINTTAFVLKEPAADTKKAETRQAATKSPDSPRS